MPRPASVHVCSACGHESARWAGQCPGCGEWNTLVEEVRPQVRRGGAAGGPRAGRLGARGAGAAKPVALAEVVAEEQARLRTGIGELDTVLATLEAERPDVCVIDSVQTLSSAELTSAPGSVGQVREVAGEIMRVAKALRIAVLLVGHVTKDGALAGPRVLEHLVDCVL